MFLLHLCFGFGSLLQLSILQTHGTENTCRSPHPPASIILVVFIKWPISSMITSNSISSNTSHTVLYFLVQHLPWRMAYHSLPSLQSSSMCICSTDHKSGDNSRNRWKPM